MKRFTNRCNSNEEPNEQQSEKRCHIPRAKRRGLARLNLSIAVDPINFSHSCFIAEGVSLFFFSY